MMEVVYIDDKGEEVMYLTPQIENILCASELYTLQKSLTWVLEVEGESYSPNKWLITS